MEIKYNIKNNFKNKTEDEIKTIINNKLLNIIFTLENNKKYLKDS